MKRTATNQSAECRAKRGKFVLRHKFGLRFVAAPMFANRPNGECPVPERKARMVLGYTYCMQFWYIYVLRSVKDHQFYIGSTNDLKRRLLQHQRGENISTAKRLPVELIYFEGHRSKEDALRREKYFKSTKGRTTLRQMLKESLESANSTEIEQKLD